jgi:hypothetical protein
MRSRAVAGSVRPSRRRGLDGTTGSCLCGSGAGTLWVLQAVDGVALKQAVDAWVSAPEAEKAARFASAETIRWLVWGTRSYQSFIFGLTLILLGGAVDATANGCAGRPHADGGCQSRSSAAPRAA